MEKGIERWRRVEKGVEGCRRVEKGGEGWRRVEKKMTLNRMTLNRIRPHIETILRINQNGFRQKRSTTSHILALRRMIEGIKDKNLPGVLLFVDFKKAFDSVHRDKLFKILIAYGIPRKIVDLIKLMYLNTKARVVTPDGETCLFDILAGVLQGQVIL